MPSTTAWVPSADTDDAFPNSKSKLAVTDDGDTETTFDASATL